VKRHDMLGILSALLLLVFVTGYFVFVILKSYSGTYLSDLQRTVGVLERGLLMAMLLFLAACVAAPGYWYEGKVRSSVGLIALSTAPAEAVAAAGAPVTLIGGCHTVLSESALLYALYAY
jgi:uncharacterized membrane protein (DUF485 family)